MESSSSSLVQSLLLSPFLPLFVYRVQTCIVNNHLTSHSLTHHDAQSVQSLFSIHVCVWLSSLTCPRCLCPLSPGYLACSDCYALSVSICVHNLEFNIGLSFLLSNRSSYEEIIRVSLALNLQICLFLYF